MKIELIRFCSDNPYNWLALAEEFLDYHGVDPLNQVTIAGLHFTGDAALWFKWYKQQVGSGLWATFTKCLLQRFEPGDQLDFNSHSLMCPKKPFMRLILTISFVCLAEPKVGSMPNF